MALLQQLDIKAPVSAQKPADNRVQSKEPEGSVSDTDKPFKEQLNEQIDQVKAQENTHNSDNNQRDNATDDESAQRETADSDNSVEPVSDEHETAVESESVKEAIQTETDIGEQSGVIANPLIATLLPQAGSALPPVSQSQNSQSVPVSVQSVVASGQSTAVTEMTQQGMSDLLNKTPVDSDRQNTPVIKSEVTTAKPLGVPVNLTATLSEKAINQDARYTKIISEMPTTDVITQTTRLQQVPLITALSGAQLSPQVSSTGLVAEPPSLLNTAAPLSNTLNSSITANIQNANWSQQMTQQVSYMIKGGFQQAEIKLNPANLGPMEIKLSMSDDKASVNFVTQHAQVRDVVDAALPRLKEMLEQQGLNLSDANVSTQSEQQQASAESQGEGADDSANGVENKGLDSGIEEQALVVDVDVNSGLSIFA
ncbi:MAG: hypothetical protein DIZ80_04270 [endosymbiont of Galathealinum brachiosum]|uniref:Flagellar hook-length control protein-like C-terminal domain-containing protein n=1 Tax=endosymbiont of Galathealinum brachiosum TaxID=2200906 RepID=A0A370DID5_9GAMM|nr:MAG: hypothetical protein DIZ80_04270 [endosymbiont of Galathealinum brachiosum]